MLVDNVLVVADVFAGSTSRKGLAVGKSSGNLVDESGGAGLTSTQYQYLHFTPPLAMTKESRAILPGDLHA
jgi:hypothetical protein